MTNDPLRVLDLFSGIGGFSLGLETISDDSLLRDRQICEKGVAETLADGSTDRRHSEAERAAEAAAAADVIVGGFPCQDISVAGKRVGIGGARSGLWSEMRRTIGLVRPRWVIVENVPALLSGDDGAWFGRVLGDLAALGYDAEWHCIPASAVGAPHRRDRVWIVAYANSNGLEGGMLNAASCPSFRSSARFSPENWQPLSERNGHRSRNGIPAYVDRIRCLGNAVVPEIVRRIGRAILERAR